MNNSSNHLGGKGTSFSSCNLSLETGDPLIKNDLAVTEDSVDDWIGASDWANNTDWNFTE